MIELRKEYDPEADIKKLSRRATKRVANALTFLIDQVLFHDFERKRRELENKKLEQEFIKKRVQNISRVYRISQEIKDPEVRRAFMTHIENSIAPFVADHPKLTSAEVVDDEGKK